MQWYMYILPAGMSNAHEYPPHPHTPPHPQALYSSFDI